MIERSVAYEKSFGSNCNDLGCPFFEPFDTNVEDWIYKPSGDSAVRKRLPMVPMRGESMDKIKNHAKLLAEMIPPLSSAAGGVKLSYLEQNEPENYFECWKF